MSGRDNPHSPIGHLTVLVSLITAASNFWPANPVKRLCRDYLLNSFLSTCRSRLAGEEMARKYRCVSHFRTFPDQIFHILILQNPFIDLFELHIKHVDRQNLRV